MTTELAPKQQLTAGYSALTQLKDLVSRRPAKEKLVIQGKQYLYFSDWQTLGAFFGITAQVYHTEEIREGDKLIGFIASARAIKESNGETITISAADAECCFDEPNWQSKPRFQLRSMAQTRACAKALRNCLSWIVKLPTTNGQHFTDTPAEEME